MGKLQLKKWEIALLLALCITLFYGYIFGEPACGAWWGTIYPELTEPAAPSAAVFSAAGSGRDSIEVRFRIAEWIGALLQRLR